MINLKIFELFYLKTESIFKLLIKEILNRN